MRPICMISERSSLSGRRENNGSGKKEKKGEPKSSLGYYFPRLCREKPPSKKSAGYLLLKGCLSRCHFGRIKYGSDQERERERGRGR